MHGVGEPDVEGLGRPEVAKDELQPERYRPAASSQPPGHGCGLPVIAIGERGSKKQYCSDSCKRKYKRAFRFASLVNDGGVDPALAAKEAGISQATALRMLERNGIEVNLVQ